MKRIKEKITIEQKEVKSFKEPVCSHQFFKIGDETKFEDGEYQRTPIRWGVKVMCSLCGEQRILWTDGEVETV